MELRRTRNFIVTKVIVFSMISLNVFLAPIVCSEAVFIKTGN